MHSSNIFTTGSKHFGHSSSIFDAFPQLAFLWTTRSLRIQYANGAKLFPGYEEHGHKRQKIQRKRKRKRQWLSKHLSLLTESSERLPIAPQSPNEAEKSGWVLGSALWCPLRAMDIEPGRPGARDRIQVRSTRLAGKEWLR